MTTKSQQSPTACLHDATVSATYDYSAGS